MCEAYVEVLFEDGLLKQDWELDVLSSLKDNLISKALQDRLSNEL